MLCWTLPKSRAKGHCELVPATDGLFDGRHSKARSALAIALDHIQIRNDRHCVRNWRWSRRTATRLRTPGISAEEGKDGYPASIISAPNWSSQALAIAAQVRVLFGKTRATRSSNICHLNQPDLEELRSLRQTLAPVTLVPKERSAFTVGVPERSERCYVGRFEPIRFSVGIHSPPLSGFWCGSPVNAIMHDAQLFHGIWLHRDTHAQPDIPINVVPKCPLFGNCDSTCRHRQARITA